MYQIGKYQIKIDTSQNQSIGYVINTQTGEVAEGAVVSAHVDVTAARAAAAKAPKQATVIEAKNSEIETLTRRIAFLEKEAYLSPAKLAEYNNMKNGG
jgi:hypothetical protein